MKVPTLKDSDLWLTPPGLISLVWKVGSIDLDPCAGLPHGWVRARHEYRLDRGQDGLTMNWRDALMAGLVYVNPPYGPGHLRLWARKVAEEANQGIPIIALLPATTGPGWWHDFIIPAFDVILFIRGRPKFVSPRTLKVAGSGTKDSAFVYFGPDRKRFREVFKGHGWFVETDRRH